MRRPPPLQLVFVTLPVFLGACSTTMLRLPTTASNAIIPAAQVERALAIADEYLRYGRIDDELRWAPYLCRQPMPGVARQSASTDQGTHGHKLYSVFAKDHAGYPSASEVGQVIVKQSWTAELLEEGAMKPGPLERAGLEREDHFYPYATKDGRTFRATEPAGLFLMYRVERGSPDSDEGWIYATVSTDRRVTASGRIESCMGCHEAAPHGRLFGVPRAP